MLLKHILNIFKLTVRRIIIINLLLCIASVLPNQYKQKNKMLIDFDYMVSQLYVQHCTFVEIGEGVCSLFIELTLDLGSSCKKPTTRQMFFGNCLCSEFRGWQLCSHQLALQRPEDCLFEEGVDCPSSSARVHRRLCDITGMSQWNTQCNCSVPLAGMQQEPLCGFRTCFANPMPASICTPRTVCGTARCDISLHGSLYAIKCDRRCKDRQSFCEQTGPATSEKRMVTSEWTEWQSLCSEDKVSIQQFEAECLDTEGKPAFDCIGPGLLCCGLEEVDCICEVKLEDGHLKIFRYTITLLGSKKESEHLSLRVRSIGLKGQAKVWNRFMDMSSKEDESDSLFSSPKLKGKNKEHLQLQAHSIGNLEPKGEKMNVLANSIMYENISQIIQSTAPPFSQIMASVASNNDLQHSLHSLHSFVNQQSELVTPSIILEKQERNHNLVSSQISPLHHPGGLKSGEGNMTSDAEKNDALDSGTNIQSSIDNSEPHEQIKEEISQYHFTLNPNTESKKLSTAVDNKAKDQNKKSFSDRVADEKIKDDFKDQTHDIIKYNNQNDDDVDKDIFLNEENKNTIDVNKKSPKQTLKISSNHNLKPETNEENENIDQEIASPTDTNTLEDNENYSKSVQKDSLTDNRITMEQNFFQNEIDYNGKGSDSSYKQKIGNETLQNHTVNVTSSIYCTKPNIQSDTKLQNVTQKTNSFEQKRNESASERVNMNEYATTVKPIITPPLVVSERPLNASINNTSSKTEDERNSTQKVSEEINGLSNSSEAKTSKKKGKYENGQSEECVSISETNTSLTNQINVESNNHLINKSLHSNDNNNTKENNTSKLASNPPETTIHPEESNISTVAGDRSTDECVTIKLENQSKPNISGPNNFYSKIINTTDVPTTTKFNQFSEPKTLNFTSQETLISLKSTQAPRESIKGKLTNSKEHILMDQKEAIQKISNLNPTLAVEEDGSKSQNSLYDEPEPVLKDLDKDDVDDNMADVLNNMIGMKHYHDKPTWTEKKATGTSKRDKVNTSKNIKHSSPSKVFASNKEDVETKVRPIKIKKTKKKIH